MRAQLVRIKAHARVLLSVLVVAIGVTVAGPALTASAAPVETGLVMPGKACAPAPNPAHPESGLPGKIYGKPATATDKDPFTDPTVPISDVYGYGYRWQNYDNGCLPGNKQAVGITTGLANLMLSSCAAVNALVHNTLSLVVTPSWLAPLDTFLTQATATIKDGFWSPWLVPIILLVGAGILILAARANASGVVTAAGWALLVLVASTYVMSYPVSSAQAVDGLIQQTVTSSATASGSEGNQIDGGSWETPEQRQARQLQNAGIALNAQMDTINRQSLYSSWLEGTLGSSTNEIATKYGPDLFRASHLTWSEAATVNKDPSSDDAKAIIDAKKKLWDKTAGEVHSASDDAYGQLTGNNMRWDAAISLALQTLLTMPFLVVAGVFVVIAFAVIRIAIPLVPAIGVFGMLGLTRGWVTSVVTNIGRYVIMGPLFWGGALVNLLFVSAMLKSSVPYAVKLILCLVIPLVLFKILRPGSAIPGMRAARRWGGRAVNALFTRRAVSDGVADGVREAEEEREQSDAPVAEPKPAPPSIGPAGDRPPAITPPNRRPRPRPTADPTADPQPNPDYVPSRSRGYDRSHPYSLTEPGTDLEPRPRAGVPAETRLRPTFYAETPALDARRSPFQLDAAPTAPSYESDRAYELENGRVHPALIAESSGGYDRAENPGTYAADAWDGEDLAAPARVMSPSERIPTGVTEVQPHVADDGAEVFVLWRPELAETEE